MILTNDKCELIISLNFLINSYNYTVYTSNCRNTFRGAKSECYGFVSNYSMIFEKITRKLAVIRENCIVVHKKIICYGYSWMRYSIGHRMILEFAIRFVVQIRIKMSEY